MSGWRRCRLNLSETVKQSSNYINWLYLINNRSGTGRDGTNENVVEKKRKAQLHPATATLKAKQRIKDYFRVSKIRLEKSQAERQESGCEKRGEDNGHGGKHAPCAGKQARSGN
jgi:hypothetical protein